MGSAATTGGTVVQGLIVLQPDVYTTIETVFEGSQSDRIFRVWHCSFCLEYPNSKCVAFSFLENVFMGI